MGEGRSPIFRVVLKSYSLIFRVTCYIGFFFSSLCFYIFTIRLLLILVCMGGRIDVHYGLVVL